jgi:hypothetical protein
LTEKIKDEPAEDNDTLNDSADETLKIDEDARMETEEEEAGDEKMDIKEEVEEEESEDEKPLVSIR